MIEKICKSLQVSLLVESDQEGMIQVVAIGENNIKNHNFITFLRGLILHNLVEKIRYEKNDDKLKVSFSINKSILNDKIINRILSIIEEAPYMINTTIDDSIKEVTHALPMLLLGLYSDGIIEYDILTQMIALNVKGIDTKTLPLIPALNFIRELNTDSRFTKKFINFGNCDYDIMYKITSPEEVKEAALAYSEGNESLRELLEFCFNNDIWTTACCKGHSNKSDKYGFVTFNLNYENTRNFFNFLVKQLLNSDLHELLFSESVLMKPIPNYPKCSIHASSGLFYTGGTVNYQYDYADQMLQLVLKYAREYVDITKKSALDGASKPR